MEMYERIDTPTTLEGESQRRTSCCDRGFMLFESVEDGGIAVNQPAEAKPNSCRELDR